MLRDRNFLDDLNLKISNRVSVVLVYLLLSALTLACWCKEGIALAVGLGISLFLIHMAFYRFFCRKRGLFFSILSIVWHWIYFFYSGLGFVIGTILYFLKRLKSSIPHLSGVSKK